MDAHLRSLMRADIFRLHILSKTQMQIACMALPSSIVVPLLSEELYEKRRKRALAYDPGVLDRARKIGLESLSSAVDSAEILQIRRGEPHVFYTSRKSEKAGKSAGASRRSIPNNDELHRGLEGLGFPVSQLTLEHMTLGQQVAAFSRARIVVAQHGAALSNILWMTPGATVIEIIPADTKPYDHFSHLAEIAQIRHVAIQQASDHSPVDLKAVVSQVADSLERDPHSRRSAGDSSGGDRRLVDSRDCTA